MSSHAEIDQLNHHLDRWMRRYRAQRAVRWALRGAASGLALALAITLIAVLRGLLLQSEFLMIAIGLMLIGLIGTAVAGFVWPRDRLTAARRFDRDVGLNERVSTALELAQADRSSGEIGQLQLRDALASAGKVNVRRQIPLRIKRADALFTAVLLAAVVKTESRFVPNARREKTRPSSSAPRASRPAAAARLGDTRSSRRCCAIATSWHTRRATT